MITKEPVSIVMPMRNSSTTVLYALESIVKQKYPIDEIIIIDNASEDNSVEKVRQFSQKTKIPIELIKREENMGVGINLNLGVKKSKSSLVVLMHSDCFLLTDEELEKLTEPLRKDFNVVASFPTIILSEKVWKTYDFWEKCFFSRQAGKGVSGFTTKFDCVRKDVYLRLGGFDMKNFGVGGEDADLHQRMKKVGKVVPSRAKVSHLQYLGGSFMFKTFLRKKRQYAMIYGRLWQKRPQLILGKDIILLSKMFLAVLPFLPHFRNIGILLIILYAFLYTRKMFTTKSTLKDYRILILPFMNIFLLYYETFWIIESFLFGKNKIE